MAEIPKVGGAPVDEFGEYDGRALDAILYDYNYDETPRVAITPFRTIYLPLLAKTHPRREDIDAVRLQWTTEVARSNRLPVFVVDDEDPKKILYRVPPLIGTVHTGLTGQEDSMNQLDTLEQSFKDRMSKLGADMRAKKFQLFNPNSSTNRQFQLDWIKILFDFGYYGELKLALGDGPYPPDVAEIIGDSLEKHSVEEEPDASKPISETVGLGEEEEYDDED